MTDDIPPRDDLAKLGEWWAAHEATLAPLLGHLNLAFLTMERAINEAIHEMLMVDYPRGEIVTSAIFSLTTRLHILDALIDASTLDEAKKSQLTGQVDKATRHNDFRNWLFHHSMNGFYGGRDGDFASGSVGRRRMKINTGKLRIQEKAISYADIKAATKGCNDVFWDLSALIREVRSERRHEEALSRRRALPPPSGPTRPRV